MPDVIQIPRQERKKQMVRCGWCLAGKHEDCILAVEMAAGTAKNKAKYPWLCPCPECKQRFSGRTRCVVCNRRGVTVDASWHCEDVVECTEYRQRRRGRNKAMKQIDDIKAEVRAERAARRRQEEETPEVPNYRNFGADNKKAKAKPKTGVCLCCGGATRGGKFLPGHDSRYVKEQAERYDAEPSRTSDGAKAIYDAMEALGPKLHGKFVKAVERLRAS